jgi:hypothetical protein
MVTIEAWPLPALLAPILRVYLGGVSLLYGVLEGL